MRHSIHVIPVNQISPQVINTEFFNKRFLRMMLRYLLFLFAFSSRSTPSSVTWPEVGEDLAGNSVSDTRDDALTHITPPQFNPRSQSHRAHRRTRLSDWCSDEQKEIIRGYLREVRTWAQMASQATRYPFREGYRREKMEEITLNRVFNGIPRHDGRAREAIGRRYLRIVEEIDNEGNGETVISCNYNHPNSDCGNVQGLIVSPDVVRNGLLLVRSIAVSLR